MIILYRKEQFFTGKNNSLPERIVLDRKEQFLFYISILYFYFIFLFYILFLVHVLLARLNDLQGMQAPGPSSKWSISIFTLKFRAHARAVARNFKVKIEIDHFFTPGSPKGALYSYLHVRHIYMSIIYTCPTYIDYIQYTYMSKKHSIVQKMDLQMVS